VAEAMKIAVIITSFPSLSETFVLSQITGLLDLGHDVRIFAWRDPAEHVVHADVAQYDLQSRTRYIPKTPRSKILCLLKAAGLIIANFHKTPGPLMRFVGMFFRRRKGLSLAHLYFLLNLTEENDFDIIHCHYGPNGLMGMFLKDAGVRGRVCTVFHGFDLSRYPLAKGPDVYEPLFRKGDLFLPVSEYWKKKLLEMGCPPEKTLVHRMGIALDAFEFRQHHIPPEGPVRLLTVGRLVQKKGHRYAIEAMARLVAQGRDVRYTIAGAGPLRTELEQLADRHNLSERITFTGAVNQDQVRRLYQEADIFVLPSITADDGDTEGVPVVLMEAMACGIPVVSTQYAGIMELVIDGVSGLLAPEKDIAALTEKLLHLLDHPQVAQGLAMAARQRVDREFDVDELNERLQTILVAECEQTRYVRP